MSLNEIKTFLLASFFTLSLYSQSSRQVLLVPGVLQTVTLSAATVPPVGNNINNWTTQNVFDLSDGTASDWRIWLSTVNDTRESGIYQQDIILRKNPAPVQISNLSYAGTGVTGPSEDRIGMHSYTHFSAADNDRTSVDYGGNYFASIGNSYYFARFFESSGYVLKCANSGALIAGCAQSFTITPAQSGAQKAYAWVRTEMLNATVTVSGGEFGSGQVLALPTAVAEYEGVVTIPLAPSNTSTTYTVFITPASLQSGASTAYLGFTRARLGGTTAGNLSSNDLLSTGHNGTPNGTGGSRVSQTDPSTRVPTPVTSVTLSLMANLQTAVNSATGRTDIHLPLGYSWTGNLILPNKSGSAFIRIVADGAPSTAYGQRANPADYPGGSSSPARIITPNELAAVANDYGNSTLSARAAHHYELVGMEIFSSNTAANLNYTLVAFSPGGGYGSPTADSTSQSHDIILRGVYIHGRDDIRNQFNGVQGDADAFGIYDSYIANISNQDFQNENHAVFFNTCHGPITLKNNYFQAASSDIIFGGGASTPFMQTQDIEIIGNNFDKDLRLNTKDGSGNYPTKPQDIKNLLEFKEGAYVTISGNVFQHSIAGNQYANGQNGQCIFIRNSSTGGSQPQDTAHFLIENNIMQNSSVGFQVEAIDLTGLGDGSSGLAGASKVPNHYITRNYDVIFRNNSLRNFSSTLWGIQGRGWSYSSFLRIDSLPTNLIIDHNTGYFNVSADSATSTTSSGPFDVAFENQGNNTVTNAEALSRGFNLGSLVATTEGSQTWVMTNNILAGATDGSNGCAQCFYSNQMTWQNNTYFAMYPTYLYNRMTSPDWFPAVGASISGNTFSQSTTLPVISGRGVNSSTLPDECVVITGNRSDIACTPGQ